MIVELRQKSQITIPAEFARKLSLSVGDKLEAVVKDGALMLIPVALYPKDYVENLENEISLLKKQIKSGDVKAFHDLDHMISSLNEE